MNVSPAPQTPTMTSSGRSSFRAGPDWQQAPHQPSQQAPLRSRNNLLLHLHHAPAAIVIRSRIPRRLGCFGLAIGWRVALAAGVRGQGGVHGRMPSAPTAWFCLLFGAGCQFLAGHDELRHKNGLGGTLAHHVFSFNWVMNYWGLSELASGRAPKRVRESSRWTSRSSSSSS